MIGRPAMLAFLVAVLSATAPTVSAASDQPADSLRGRVASCVDFRSGETFTIGAQRLLPNGTIASDWEPDGSRLCLGTAQEVAQTAIGDGSGGAIVVWVDARSGDADLYVQRLSAAGAVFSGWQPDGLVVCAAHGSQYQVALASDGAAGAIVAWQDYRGGESGDIYAQRVLGDGTLAWIADGAAVCADSGDQAAPAIAADGAGGAHVIWHDRRGPDADLYYAHLASDGSLQQPAQLLISGPGDQVSAIAAPDGVGGCFVVWRDTHGGSAGLYALRLDASGAPSSGWPSEGLALVSDGPLPLLPAVSLDGAGGLLAAWCERRTGPGDIRSQRLSPEGTRVWADSGVVVCAEAHEQYAPSIISDGSGGAIVAWEDHRAGPSDLYAQRVLAAGGTAWSQDGVPLAIASGNQLDVSLIPDGLGGALATWSDGSVSGRASFVRARPAIGERVPRFKSVESGPGRARLAWTTEAGDRRAFQLERRTDAEEWRSLAEVRADAQGELTFEDRTVQPGTLATYRLSLTTPRGAVYLEEIPVSIPAPMPMALRFARSEQGGHAIRVSFVLETHERARVELMDIAGRRVLTQDLGSPGAGEHDVSFGSRELASGLYFVRLFQGRAVRTARLTLIR